MHSSSITSVVTPACSQSSSLTHTFLPAPPTSQMGHMCTDTHIPHSRSLIAPSSVSPSTLHPAGAQGRPCSLPGTASGGPACLPGPGLCGPQSCSRTPPCPGGPSALLSGVLGGNGISDRLLQELLVPPRVTSKGQPWSQPAMPSSPRYQPQPCPGPSLPADNLPW